MSSETKVAAPLTIDHKPHAVFFRQSGWYMIATVVAGVFSFALHLLNKFESEAAYSNFGVLLMVISCVPTIPLQMVFTQQTAATLATNRERQLAGMIRRAWVWTFVLWLVPAIVVIIFRQQIASGWNLSGSLPLFVTLAAILASVLAPLFSGVLQGRQDFFWLGWALILGGILRLVAAAVLVIAFHCGATGMLAGALVGVGVASFIALWRTRDLWTLPSEPFNARALFKEIMPLALGFGVCQFLFTTDTMYATSYFSPVQMKPYIAAGTLSRGLLWLVLPMAAVMFPKLVHSRAKGEKSNLLGIVIIGTALLAVCGAAVLCLVGPLVVKLIYTPKVVASTMALLPWYAGVMIPLALANVLVNDSLANGRFKVVPFMIVIAIGYAFTLPYLLNRHPGDMTVVLKTLGVFNLLLFTVCAVFTWVIKPADGRGARGEG